MAQPLIKKDDDHDDELEYSPFMGIEKGAVLQEARVFNDPQLDPRRCSQVITKLLYSIYGSIYLTKESHSLRLKQQKFSLASAGVVLSSV